MSVENMDPNAWVRALEKLLDYTASGIGAVAGPMLATWQARREAEALRIAAQGEADALRIIAAAQSDARDALVSTASSVQGEIDIAETVRQRIQFQEEKRHRNIGSVVGRTAEELGDKYVPDQEPDHDWTACFFNYIQYVSSEGMQSLWAKVLAGEIERPGSVSIRSLSILRDLDQASANLFQTLCSARLTFQMGVMGGDPLNVGNEIVLSLDGNAAHNSLERFGLNYNNLNVLNEYGIIIPEYNSSVEYEIFTDVSKSDGSLRSVSMAFRFQGRSWILVPTEQQPGVQSIALHGIILTKAGMELAKVVDLVPMPEYSEAIANFFVRNGFRMVEHNPGTTTQRSIRHN